MNDAADRGRRNLVLVERRAPPAELQVSGDCHRLLLVGDDERLEEQSRSVGVRRQEAELVDGERPRGRGAPLSRVLRGRMTSDDAVKKRASILCSCANVHSSEAVRVLPVSMLMFTKNWSEWPSLFEHRGH